MMYRCNSTFVVSFKHWDISNPIIVEEIVSRGWVLTSKFMGEGCILKGYQQVFIRVNKESFQCYRTFCEYSSCLFLERGRRRWRWGHKACFSMVKCVVIFLKVTQPVPTNVKLHSTYDALTIAWMCPNILIPYMWNGQIFLMTQTEIRCVGPFALTGF